MAEKSIYKLLQESRADHEKLRDNPVEAGDLADAVGRSYMKGLWKAIVDNRNMQMPILYFIIITKKDLKDSRIIRITITARKRPLKYLHQNVDLWRYDYMQDKLELLWSLPHRTEIKTLMRNPDQCDLRLLEWMTAYIKQDKINIKDKSACKLKS